MDKDCAGPRLPESFREVKRTLTIGPALRLAQSSTLKPCTLCRGKGTVPCPRGIAVRTLNRGRPADTAGEGSPIPCPECKGRKAVPT